MELEFIIRLKVGVDKILSFESKRPPLLSPAFCAWKMFRF
jgi:hypothetical protein